MIKIAVRVVLRDGTRIESDPPFEANEDFTLKDGYSLFKNFSEIFFSESGFTMQSGGAHLCFSQDMMIDSLVSWKEVRS